MGDLIKQRNRTLHGGFELLFKFRHLSLNWSFDFLYGHTFDLSFRFTNPSLFLFASCPHAASISLPRLLLTFTMIFLPSRNFAKAFKRSTVVCWNSPSSIGLYSMIFTLQ